MLKSVSGIVSVLVQMLQSKFKILGILKTALFFTFE